MEGLEEKLTKAVDDAIEKNLKPLMESQAKEAAFAQIKNVVEQLRSQRNEFGMDKTGLSLAQKKEFAQKVVDLFTGKAQTVASPEKGGLLIPDEVYSGILKVSEDFGYIMGMATKMPMADTQSLTVPKYTAAASGQEWEYLGENGEATETDVSIGNAVLNLKLAIKIVRLDSRLLRAASVGLSDWLISIFAQSLAYTIDKQAFIGTGSPFVGILNDANITVVTMAATETSFDDVTLDHLTQLEAAVNKGARAGAGYFMNLSIWNKLKTKKSSTGEYLFQQDNNFVQPVRADGMLRPVGYTNNGYPVYDIDVLPAFSATAVSTKFMVFGNMQYMLMGEAGAMVIAQSDHATVGGKNVFAAVQTALRVTHEHALAVGNEKAFAMLKTAAA